MWRETHKKGCERKKSETMCKNYNRKMSVKGRNITRGGRLGEQ